jgi:hypothetical protein
VLKKFGMEDYAPISTPMITGCKLSKDDESLEEKKTLYESMIGILLYLTTSRIDIMQAVGLVARIQFAPCASNKKNTQINEGHIELWFVVFKK